MRDELLGYYERELAFLRQMGAEFAHKYPKIAGRLQLDADKCEDPHVERMIESFAFLAGRIRLKVDDEFPEVTESLLNVLYPHYLSPVPSMSIAQFTLDSQQGKLTTGYKIEREAVLYSQPFQGTPCRFRTSYPVIVWPIEVTSAALESLDPVDTQGRWKEAVIRISLSCINDTKLSDLKLGDEQQLRRIESLRFYLNGDPHLVYAIYEMIFNKATRVELRAHSMSTGNLQRPAQRPIVLPPSTLKSVGFEPGEGMLPYSARSFLGYRLLTEYFAFPEKFLFFDVAGLDKAAQAGFGDRFDILIYVRDVPAPRATIDASVFQLGCSPIINLFTKIAEPIQLNQKQNEYHVIPDVHRQMATEVYSIDSVITADPYLKTTRHFQPFYSFRHAYDDEYDRTFWYANRRASQRPDDPGTEVYVSLVDLAFNPHIPAAETVTLHTTCTNRDLPSHLPFGGREGDFEVETGAPLSRVRCLRKPTDTARPPLRRGQQWRLISHLALNHLSIVGGESEGAREALREILLLYDFMDTAATRKQIAGVSSVSSRRVVRQTGSRIGSGFVRGVETSIEFDEDQYVGSGVFLFASVLERFLALYSSINSFSQLAAKTRQSEGYLKVWSPRSGEQILL